MRFFAVVLAAGLSVIISWLGEVGIAEAAQTRAVPFFGIWKGGAFDNDQTHKFSHCAAFAPYRSGIVMIVAVDRSYGWRLLFTNPAWNLNVGKDIPLVITFDGTAPWSGTANATDSHTARVEMQPTSALVESFRGARKMMIDAGGQYFGFDLDGTSRLMVSLTRCVGNSLAIERGDLPPNFVEAPAPPPTTRSVTPPASPPGPPQANRAAELELEMAATRIASNLLLQARLANARLLSAAETPASLKGRGAVWTSDAGLGAVELLSAAAGKGPQQVASSILLDDASSCKGDFASSRSSELVDGNIVTKATSLCTDSGGVRTYRYFILQADPAGYVVYALAGAGGASGTPATAPMQDAEFQAAAVKAAFTPK